MISSLPERNKALRGEVTYLRSNGLEVAVPGIWKLLPIFLPFCQARSLWADSAAPLYTQGMIAVIRVIVHQLGFTQWAFIFSSVKLIYTYRIGLCNGNFGELLYMLNLS